jgi:ATP-dependent helicase/nuclease subunit A
MAWTKEQQEAIDKKGTNIIVSAGAGSGKTAVLTARTLRILKEGTHINELLILTFTKAAAAEMKERIRSSIADNPNLKQELDLIDQSYVTTFDSFALSVVKKYHYLENISNNISISEESIIEMKKEEILEEVFNKYYESREENFTKLIKDFCVKDDITLKKSLLKIASKIDGMPTREEYLNNYLSNLDDNKIFNEYLNIVNDLKDKYNNTYEDFISSLSENYSNKIEEYGTNLYNAKTINEMSTSLDNLPKFPVLKLDEDASHLRENYKVSIEELKNILKYGTEDEIKEGLNKSKVYLKAILNIIKDFLDELHDYKAKNEIYDFQDIALLSIKILKEHPEVRDELRNTFKEIMIDEYQDTNDIQETFISMIENNNVYMVGDIKQSIYRFRNANPYIFKNKYDNYKDNNGGIKIDLVKNFRSREEIKTGINDIFNLIMDNVIGGAEYQESHQMVFGNTSYNEEGKTNQDYNLEILEYPYDKDTPYTKEEIEIFAIAKDIKNKIDNKYQVFDKGKKVLKDIEYRDFVILMDRAADFDLYKKVFEYLGIPLTLYKDDKINNSDDIYIIKNIIDFIVNINLEEYDTNFKYDFTSIARSYLYDYEDEEIFKYFLNDNFKDSSIYQDFKEIADNITHLSITELLESIITKTNMYQKLITVGDIDAAILRISKLIDIADNLSNLGYDIYTFRDYLNTLIDEEYDMKYSALDDGSNAVKIMTIHKSKGLEYHICYYSGLYKKFNIQDLNDRFLFDNRYGIITPYFDEGIHETITKYLTKYHYLEEEVGERIRLFYVALTRAKEKMIMLTPSCELQDYLLESNGTIDESIRRAYRSFTAILESIKDKIPNYYHEIDINDLGITNEYLFNKVKENKLPKSKEVLKVTEISIPESEELDTKHFSKETHNLIDKNTYDNLQLGLKVHEILELLDLKNPNLELIDDEFIKEKVSKFLTNDILKNIDKSRIYKEHEFIYTKENIEYHGIIDLMIEYDDHIDIIDYKLNNIKDENYLNQLNGYKEYISDLTKKETNIYLYSIIGETLEKL